MTDSYHVYFDMDIFFLFSPLQICGVVCDIEALAQPSRINT